MTTKEEKTDKTDKVVSYEELVNVWKEFATRFKLEGQTSQYIIMDREIKLDKETILLELDNWIQVDQLNDFKAELLEYLRKKLENFSLSLQTSISETITSKKIYTSKEKFQYLAEKYPMLHELRSKFGLETDF